MLWLLVVILLVLALAGGLNFGSYGYAGLSPAAIVLIILVILLLTGGIG